MNTIPAYRYGYLWTLITALFMGGCGLLAPEPSLEVTTRISRSIEPVEFGGAIAYSLNGDLFLLYSGESTPIQLTQTPTIRKHRVALSYDLSKVAYIAGPDSLVFLLDVATLESEVVQTIGPVMDLGWLNGDQALFTLSGNQLEYHLGTPPNNVPTALTSTFPRITSVSFSASMDVVYVCNGTDAIGSPESVVTLLYANPSQVDRQQVFSSRFEWARFSPTTHYHLIANFISDPSTTTFGGEVRYFDENRNTYLEIPNSEGISSPIPMFNPPSIMATAHRRGNDFESYTNVFNFYFPDQFTTNILTYEGTYSEYSVLDWKP